MKNNIKRKNIHVTTLPSWALEGVDDDMTETKDPRESLEAIKQLLESGIKGPNFYSILASISNPAIKIKIPETLIKLPNSSTIFLHNDEKGLVKVKTDEK